jgi:hypothetical protein
MADRQVANQWIASGGEKMNVKMSRKWLVSLSVTLGMLILLWAIGSAMAQGPEPQGDISAAATVNSRISYQGVLTESGTPVNGNRNMVFNFYTNNTCSGVAVLQVIKNNVPVTDGLFSVELDVTHAVFWGQGLWLEVEVGGTSIGCQEILPVPYALSLRPGAEVIGDVASPSAVLDVTQFDAGSAAFGVYGYAPTTAIYGCAIETGVMGHSYGHEGGRAGVYGESVVGVGVRGTSAMNHGVYGESDAPSYATGYGGFFVNTGGGNLLAANNANSSSDLEFRVANNGSVYSDNAFYCRWNYTGTGTGGAIREADLEGAPCLVDNTDADFAEMMPADEGLEPGDVLVIAPDGRLVRSDILYATNVAGVYSTRPSYVGGGRHMGEPGYVPLAMMGLVPVKASAENGPIAPGDMLVASATPGHAMKADPNPPVGTIIGKALEGLEDSTGVIQMLVMLQ